MKDYCLYSIRMNAWLSNIGTGSSDFKQAHRLSREDAIDLCKLQRQADGTMGAIPVRVEDIEEVIAK